MSVSTASVRGVLSAGTGLAFSGGQFSLSANSDQISEGSSNKFLTSARVRSKVSASGAGLSYDSGTGAFSLSANTDDIGEGGNLYFTDARARAAITADPAASNLATVASGVVNVPLSKLRTEFLNTSLTANTFATLSHSLGKKLVHVTAMNSSGDLVQLEVQFTDANSCKVKANSNVTVDIAVSL